MKSKIVILLFALAFSAAPAWSAESSDWKFVNSQGKPISESDVPAEVLKNVRDSYPSHQAPICAVIVNCHDAGQEEHSTSGIAAHGRGLMKDHWVSVRREVLSPTKLLLFTTGFDALWRLNIQKMGFGEIKFKMPDIEEDNAFVWLGEYELRPYEGPMAKVYGTICGGDGKRITESGLAHISPGLGPDPYGAQVPIRNGQYEVELTPGDYWFVVETDSYSGETFRVTAEAGKTVQHDVTAYPHYVYQFKVRGQDGVAQITGGANDSEITDRLGISQDGKQIRLNCKDNDTIIRIKRGKGSRSKEKDCQYSWWGVLYQGDCIQLVNSENPEIVKQTVNVIHGPLRPKS